MFFSKATTLGKAPLPLLLNLRFSLEKGYLPMLALESAEPPPTYRSCRPSGRLETFPRVWHRADSTNVVLEMSDGKDRSSRISAAGSSLRRLERGARVESLL